MSHTTGDEAGMRETKLASLRRMVEIGAGKGAAQAFTSDQLWVSDVAFLLAELERVTAERDEWKATLWKERKMDAAHLREYEEAIASRNAWAEKAKVVIAAWRCPDVCNANEDTERCVCWKSELREALAATEVKP